MAPHGQGPGAGLDAFFVPRSLAVVGASDDPTKIGGRPIKYLREMSFLGRIFPVNPRRDRLQGLPCFGTIEEIPEPFDHAVIAVTAAHVPAALLACAAKGARGVTIFTSGFAEVGAEGRRLQREIGEAARRLGLRILGPNCQGFANIADAVCATFSSGLERAAPAPGPLAVISQSGVLSAVLYVLLREAGLGVSQWINTGNEEDIDAAQALAYAVRRPDVATAVLALETVRNGEAFVEAVAEARRCGKEVLVLKGGRTGAGGAAAASHTAAILGRDDAYDALFRRSGAVRVRTLQELVDAAVLATRIRRPAAGSARPAHGAPVSTAPRAASSALPAAAPASRPEGAAPGGPRLGIITNSGGASVLIADAATARGMRVPAAGAGLIRALARVLPEYAVAQNPLDLTGYYVSHPEALDGAAGCFASSGEFDALLIYLGIIGRLYQVDHIVASFERIARAPIPAIVVWHAGDAEVARRIAAAGLPAFDDPDRAVAAVDTLFRSRRAWTGASPRPRAPRRPAGPRAARRAVADAREAGRGRPSPAAMRDLLEAYGIPAVNGILCRTPEEAAAAVQAIGGPAVLKIESRDVVHKTDAGAVRAGIVAPADAARAFQEIVRVVSARCPEAGGDGVRVEPMRAGVEMILGTLTDPALGAFVSVGTGGVLVEVLRDAVMRRLPLAPGEAGEMVAELRGRALLGGFRGAPPADRAGLIAALERWAALAYDLSEDLVSAEINPLIVGAEGDGVVAVDVMMVLREA